jgi:transmembrane sensor
MSSDPSSALPPDDTEAIAWVWRLDRGLSPDEQDRFFQWLAADPAHADALRRCRAQWSRFNQVADWRPEHSERPNADLLAPAAVRPVRRRVWPWALAASLAVAGGLVFQLSRTTGPAETVASVRTEDRRILPDRSAARLNAGAQIAVLYAPGERRVRLERGEAFFTVQPEPGRPFVVEAGGVDIRAVGTAFNVQLSGDGLEVIVTHGTVALAAPASVAGSGGAAVLQANQRAKLALAEKTPAAAVESIDHGEIQRRLSWQHGMMSFRDEALGAIVAELNRINATHIRLDDTPLAALRFSGTIRSDNVSGFARLLETAFGAEVVAADDREIRLRSKPAAP